MITWIVERLVELADGMWAVIKFFAPGIALWLVIMITWCLLVIAVF